MPTNALFLPYVAGVQAAATVPLMDPRPVRRLRSHYLRDEAPELEHANAFCAPSGRWPSRGWVVVRRGDYNQIGNLYATNFGLNFTDVQTGSSVTFQNLAVVQARCVSRGVAADPNALYLVELTDGRGIVDWPWFAFPTTSQYNQVAVAYPGQYFALSTNGGSAWSWSGMVGDLWKQMAAFLGPFPGLPASITPSGTPQDFCFPGESAWAALNRILDLLGMTIAVDPTAAAPYKIVLLGAADPALAALQTKYAGVLEDDYEYIDAGAGRAPGKIVVYFHRRNAMYGTEETVRFDRLQWSSTPLYSVTVPGPAQFAAAPGTGYLWDDFTVQFDVDGVPLPTEAANAAAIAQERVTQYYARIYRGTAGFMRQTYTGALPFATGSLVDGVKWSQTKDGYGWRTELVRGPEPPWSEVGVAES